MPKRSIVVGSSKTGEPIEVNISNPPRIGILGNSGSGKSVLLSNLILLLAREMRENVQFLGIDPKCSSLVPVAARFAMPIVSEAARMLPFLQQVEQLMLSRYSEMRELGITKIDPHNPEHTKRWPMIVLIIEELLSVTNSSDIPKSSIEAIKRILLTLSTRMRACNCTIWMVSHTFDSTSTIPVAARSQLDTRFIMQTGINENRLFAEGMDEMCPGFQLSESGTFFFAQNNLNLWVKGKTFYQPDEKIEQIAEAYSIDVRDIGMSWTVDNPFEF